MGNIHSGRRLPLVYAWYNALNLQPCTCAPSLLTPLAGSNPIMCECIDVCSCDISYYSSVLLWLSILVGNGLVYQWLLVKGGVGNHIVCGSVPSSAELKLLPRWHRPLA